MQGFGGLSKRPYMIGTAQVACKVQGSLVYLQLTDCFYHPQAGCTIISTAQLRKRGATLCFTNSPPGITMTCKGIPFHAVEDNNLYLLNLWENRMQPVALPAYSLTEASLEPWHERLAHVGESGLKKLSRAVNGMSALPPTHVCNSCVLGKMKERSHSKPFQRGEYPLEFIHFDIKGLLPAGIHGERYLLVVVDDATSMPGSIAIGQRSDLTDALIYRIERHERPERRCRRARFDQAGENMDTRLVYFFRDRGIQAECTGTEQHQSNGVAEVTIRILWERVQSTIASSQLPKKYWPYIAEAVAYLRQFEIHPRVQDKTMRCGQDQGLTLAISDL